MIFIFVVINICFSVNGQKKKDKKTISNYANELIIRSKLLDNIAKKSGINTDSKEWKQSKGIVSGALGTGDFDLEIKKLQQKLSEKRNTRKKYEGIGTKGNGLWEIRREIKNIIRNNHWNYNFFKDYYMPYIENEKGYQGGRYLLHILVDKGYTNIVDLIINRGFPVDKRSWTGKNNNTKGETALEIAAASKKGRYLIPFLITKGASLHDSRALQIAIESANFVAIDCLWKYSYNNEKSKALIYAYEEGNIDVINFLTLKLNAKYQKQYVDSYVRCGVKYFNYRGMKSLLYKNLDDGVFDPSRVLIQACKSSRLLLVSELCKIDFALEADQLIAIIKGTSLNIKNTKSVKLILEKFLQDYNEKEKIKIGAILTKKENYELLYLAKNKIGERYIKSEQIKNKLNYYPIVKLFIVDRIFLNNISLSMKNTYWGLLFSFWPIIIFWIFVKRKIWSKIFISLTYFLFCNLSSVFIAKLTLEKIFNLDEYQSLISILYIQFIWLIAVFYFVFKKTRKIINKK